MAEHDTSPAEIGAEMDYNEHEKTYSLFLAMTKWGIIACVALLAAMAFGFFTPAGFISSLILFILISAVGGCLL